MERRVGLQLVEQVVFAALQLHARRRFHAVFANLLVQLLPVAAQLHRAHEDVFRGHERHFLVQVPPHHARVHAPAGDQVAAQRQNRVGSEERLGQGDAPVGGIVQRALHPLCGGRPRRIQRVGHDVARQRTHALAAHRVALVGHRRGTDLLALERLVEFLQMRKQAKIGRHLRRALRDAAQNVQHKRVHLAGVRLSGNRHARFETHLARDQPLERPNLGFVAVKQHQKARAGARRALAAQRFQARKFERQAVEIH